MSEISNSQKTALLKLPGMKDLQKQFAKENKMAGSGKRRMKGRGDDWWSSVYNWFETAGRDINQFLKDTKIVSNVAAYALPILGSMGAALLTVNPLGAVAGGIAGKSAAEYIKSQGYGSTHRMPDGSIMKGKMHGGELSNKLVINPVGQRLMGKGIFENVLNTFVPLGGLALSNAQNTLSKVKKLTGKGANDTFGMNGVQQTNTAPMKSGIMKNIKGNGPAQDFRLLKKGKSMVGTGGIPYGSISSEFGNMRFA